MKKVWIALVFLPMLLLVLISCGSTPVPPTVESVLEEALPEPPPQEVSVPEPPVEEKPAEPQRPMAEKFYVYENPSYFPPIRAVAPDGTVLATTLSGRMEPLIDKATGEYAAILISQPSQSSRERTYEIYAMDGSTICTGLNANQIELFGGIAVVAYWPEDEYSVSLYRKETGECIAVGLRSAQVSDDYLRVQPVDDVEEYWFYDRNGQRTIWGLNPDGSRYAETSDGVRWNWDGDENGKPGLLRAMGREFARLIYQYASYDENYVYADMGDVWQAIDPETEAVVFEWPGRIWGLYEHTALVSDGDVDALISREGEILFESNGIVPRRFGSGEPCYFLSIDDNPVEFTTCIGPDGTVLFHNTRALLEEVDSTTLTVWYCEEEVLRFFDIRTGAEWELSDVPGYTGVSVINDYTGRYAGLCYRMQNVNFFDESLPPAYACDLIRTDGTVVLPDLAYSTGKMPDDLRQDDVFLCRSGPYIGLRHLDGSWLYLPHA